MGRVKSLSQSRSSLPCKARLPGCRERGSPLLFRVPALWAPGELSPCIWGPLSGLKGRVARRTGVWRPLVAEERAGPWGHSGDR